MMKGVTIASQHRYIKYFETFLMANFVSPYYKMIPKIVKSINCKTTNIINNFINDMSYFITPNSFYLNSIKIGPFTTSKSLNVTVKDFLNSNFKEKFQEKKKIEKVIVDNVPLFYYVVV